MKKLFLSIFLFLTSPAINAQGILDTYDSEPIIWRMTCWTGETGTGETGYKTYAIQGKNIVVETIFKIPISEQKGNIYAGTIDDGGEWALTLIVDYDNRRVTQRIFDLEFVFECN